MTRVGALLLTVLGTASLAGAEKIQLREDTFLTLGALLQPQAAVAEAAAPDGGMGTDFFVRRMRLIVAAQVVKGLSFFFDTEQANLGKDGNWETSIYIQDAFVSFEPVAGLAFDAGMMLIPFTRHNMQSAAALNGLDYHAKLILFPGGGNRVWRDAGLQVRADLAGERLHLRGGVFNGVEGAAPATEAAPMRNRHDAPRVAGHARLDLAGREKGFFYSGISFSETPIVSIGLGFDWQPDVVMSAGGAADHMALAADVFAELPTVPGQELVLQATAVLYDDGPLAATTGKGFFAEVGYRIRWLEPIVAFELFDSDVEDASWRAFHAGAAFFIDRHRANVKVNGALTRQGQGASVLSAALQAQLYF
jgi:hypothetical protein